MTKANFKVQVRQCEVEILTHHEYMQSGRLPIRITFAAKVVHTQDWAAYVCASGEQDYLEPKQFKMTEAEAVSNCLAFGNKLSEDVARALFPGVEEPYRK
jgi:hypothetical protein